MKPGRINFFLLLAIMLASSGSISHLITYIPTLRMPYGSLTALLFFGVFITIIPATLQLKKMKSEADGMKLKRIFTELPTTVKTPLKVFAAYFIFNFFFSHLVLNKMYQPEVINGKYVLVSKGVIKEDLSEEQYYKHIAYSYRGNSGHFIFFQIISIILLVSAKNELSKTNEIKSPDR